MAPPLPYIPTASEAFAEPLHFLEEVGGSQPGGGAAFSPDSQEATRVGRTAFARAAAAGAYFCGWATCDPGPPYRIRRANPAPHPRYPWLFARSVAETPQFPQPNAVVPALGTQKQSNFYPELRYGDYQDTVLTVRYSNLRYAIRPDLDIDKPDDEWKRNVFWDATACQEVLQADNASQLFWAETKPGLGGGGPLVGSVVPSSQIALLAKTRVVMTLVQWPWDYVSSDPDIPLLNNFQDCVGKVNSTGVFGTIEGTLLCRGFNYEPVYFPITPADPTRPLKGLNIHVEFELFDPVRGGEVAGGVRGHNLMPFRGDGLYYLVTRDGTEDGPRLIGQVDFNKMLFAWNDPNAP